MKTLEEFLLHLSSLDVKLWADGEQLHCDAPTGVLTPVLHNELAARKTDILVRLQQGNGAPDSTLAPIQPTSRENGSPLSFGQQRLWFLDQLRPQNAAYNLPVALRLSGSLKVDVAQRAFAEVVRRHEMLRTSFVNREGGFCRNFHLRRFEV